MQSKKFSYNQLFFSSTLIDVFLLNQLAVGCEMIDILVLEKWFFY